MFFPIGCVSDQNQIPHIRIFPSIHLVLFHLLQYIPQHKMDQTATDDVMVTLCSQEGQKFEVKKSIIKQSELVLTMIDDDDNDDNDDDDTTQEIPLPNVREEVLKKVIAFCEHHATADFPEIEKPLKSSNMQEVVGEWDATYVECDMEFLFELILAANYMDIKSLLDLTCAKVRYTVCVKMLCLLSCVFVYPFRFPPTLF